MAARDNGQETSASSDPCQRGCPGGLTAGPFGGGSGCSGPSSMRKVASSANTFACAGSTLSEAQNARETKPMQAAPPNFAPNGSVLDQASWHLPLPSAPRACPPPPLRGNACSYTPPNDTTQRTDRSAVFEHVSAPLAGGE